MDWQLALALAIGVLMVLFALGVPVFAAFLAINVAGTLWLMGTAGFGMFTNSIYDTVTSETLTTIALFVLMGELLFRSGSIDVIFDSLDTLMGRVKGRLYFFVIALSTLFGALSGSALAVTAMLCRSALPTMRGRPSSGRGGSSGWMHRTIPDSSAVGTTSRRTRARFSRSVSRVMPL